MSTRRKFFSRLAGALGIIALAPELAFRAKLALPEVEGPELIYACNQIGIYAQLEACGAIVAGSQTWIFDIKRGDDGKEYYIMSDKNFDENYAL